MFNQRTTTVMIGLLLAIIACQTFAYRPEAGPTKPPIIATFDIETVFNSIGEKKAADAALLALANQMKDQTEAELAKADALKGDLEAHVAGSPKHKELTEQLMLLAASLRADQEFNRAKIDHERAKTLRRIYKNIRAAAQTLATSHGYGIIFVDDSVSELPVDGTEEEINRQISARRMIYTAPEVDITQQLIAELDRAFIAAGGKIPPADPAAPANGGKQP